MDIRSANLPFLFYIFSMMCLVTCDVKFPSAFSASTEVFLPDATQVQYRNVFVDSGRNIYAIDLASPKLVHGKMVQRPENNVIDLKNSLYYQVIKADKTTCKIYITNQTNFVNGYADWFIAVSDMFKIMQKDNIAQNEPIYDHAVPCDVYQRNDTFTLPNMSSIVYNSTWKLLKSPWTYPETQLNTSRPLRVAVERKNKTFVIDFNEWSSMQPYLQDFSINACYETSKKKKAEVKFDVVNNKLLVVPMKKSDVDKIVEHLAEKINITVLRFAETNYSVSPDKKSVTISTYLLAHASEIDVAIKIGAAKNLKVSFDSLIKIAKSGVELDLAGTKIKSKEAHEWKPPKNPGPRYTPGAMGGLAVGMLISGTLIGLVIALLCYSSRTGENPVDVIRSGLPGR